MSVPEVKRLAWADGQAVTPPSSTLTVPVQKVFTATFAGGQADIDVSAEGLNAQKCGIVAIWAESGDYVDRGFEVQRPAGSTTTLRLISATASGSYKALVVGSA